MAKPPPQQAKPDPGVIEGEVVETTERALASLAGSQAATIDSAWSRS
jgi:hypothetical protein